MRTKRKRTSATETELALHADSDLVAQGATSAHMIQSPCESHVNVVHMLTLSSGPFVCVSCGHGPYDSIFKIYGSAESGDDVIKPVTHLRLTECTSCKHPVDDYVELETGILLIDAILLKKKFTRHLINCDIENKSFIKFAVILIVADTVFKWSRNQNKDSAHYVDMEYQFYMTFAEMLWQNLLIYSLIILSLMAIVKNNIPVTKVIQILVICSFAKLMNILTMLWPSDELQTVIEIIIHMILMTSMSQSLVLMSSDGKGKDRLSFVSAAAIVVAAKLILVAILLLRSDMGFELEPVTIASLVVQFLGKKKRM